MYAKIFTQILESSIAADYTVRHVFEDMLKLCNIDGVVDIPIDAIARRTNTPIEIVERAIKELEQPDRSSRTPDHEGRRIVRIDDHRDWGWIIVNYKHYRSLVSEEQRREKTRIRVQKFRSKKSDSSSDDSVTQCNASNAMQREMEKQIVTIYNAYPKHVGKPKALKAIQSAIKKFGYDQVLSKTALYASSRINQDPQFTPHPSTWFNQERFNDDPSTWVNSNSQSGQAPPVRTMSDQEKIRAALS